MSDNTFLALHVTSFNLHSNTMYEEGTFTEKAINNQKRESNNGINYSRGFESAFALYHINCISSDFWFACIIFSDSYNL